MADAALFLLRAEGVPSEEVPDGGSAKPGLEVGDNVLVGLGALGLVDTVTLSRSVFRVIRSLDRMGTDAAARTCEKDGPSMRGQLAAQV